MAVRLDPWRNIVAVQWNSAGPLWTAHVFWAQLDVGGTGSGSAVVNGGPFVMNGVGITEGEYAASAPLGFLQKKFAGPFNVPPGTEVASSVAVSGSDGEGGVDPNWSIGVRFYRWALSTDVNDEGIGALAVLDGAGTTVFGGAGSETAEDTDILE